MSIFDPNLKTNLELARFPSVRDPQIQQALIDIHNAIFRLAEQLDTVITLSQDLRFENSGRGVILKDTQATPHYWRVTVSTVGALVVTDIGTSLPA